MKKAEWDELNPQNGDTLYYRGLEAKVVRAALRNENGTTSTGNGWNRTPLQYARITFTTKKGEKRIEEVTYRGLYTKEQHDAVATEAEAKKKAAAKQRADFKKELKNTPQVVRDEIEKTIKGYKREGRLCADEYNKLARRFDIPTLADYFYFADEYWGYTSSNPNSYRNQAEQALQKHLLTEGWTAENGRENGVKIGSFTIWRTGSKTQPAF